MEKDSDSSTTRERTTEHLKNQQEEKQAWIQKKQKQTDGNAETDLSDGILPGDGQEEGRQDPL